MAGSLLSKRLRELRKAHNFTQDYVAVVLGTTRQTYSHYETGIRKPGYDVLYKLSGLYNISVEDLMHLSVELDDDFFEAPAPSKSSDDLAAFLEFFNDPKNQQKFKYNSNLERELLYYFMLLSDEDKKCIVECIKIRTKKE